MSRSALRHNEPRGWVVVTTAVDDGHAILRVANSGAVVPEPEIHRLFEPFQRLASDRISREGHGLGLSIVRAVASARGATATAASQPRGDLDVRVGSPLDLAGDVQGPVADASGTAGVVVRTLQSSPSGKWPSPAASAAQGAGQGGSG